MIEKTGHSLDSNTEGFVRLVHECAEVLEISRQQMGGLARDRGPKNGLVLPWKPRGKIKSNRMRNKPEYIRERIQVLHKPRKLPFQISACLFYCINTGIDLPVPLS